jgi:membrane protease YdiL (CAAX protease family)
LKIKTLIEVTSAYFAFAFLVLLSAHLSQAEAGWGNFPTFLSVLLLIPIYVWYGGYRKKMELSKEIKPESKATMLLWIFALFALALSIRIPSVLLFWAPYEKTPLILLTISTIIVIEKTDVSAFGFVTRRLGKSLLHGLSFFLVLNVLSLVITYLLTYILTGQSPFRSFDPLPFLLAMPFMTLCVGISEEGLFRGYMQTHLEKIYTPRNAIFTQALLFGAWHFVWNLSPFSPFAMAQYVATTFFLGLFFGYFYNKTRNLMPLVFAHGLWNSVAQGIMENQSAFEALERVAPLTQILNHVLPYMIAGLLTFFCIKYFVKEVSGNYCEFQPSDTKISTAFLTKMGHFSSNTFAFRASLNSWGSDKSYPMSSRHRTLPFCFSNCL